MSTFVVRAIDALLGVESSIICIGNGADDQVALRSGYHEWVGALLYGYDSLYVVNYITAIYQRIIVYSVLI